MTGVSPVESLSHTLWWTNIAMENHHFYSNGKIHYKWPFSIAILVHQVSISHLSCSGMTGVPCVPKSLAHASFQGLALNDQQGPQGGKQSPICGAGDLKHVMRLANQGTSQGQKCYCTHYLPCHPNRDHGNQNHMKLRSHWYLDATLKWIQPWQRPS